MPNNEMKYLKRPRMFAVVESLDDEDIHEDEAEYRRLHDIVVPEHPANLGSVENDDGTAEKRKQRRLDLLMMTGVADDPTVSDDIQPEQLSSESLQPYGPVTGSVHSPPTDELGRDDSTKEAQVGVNEGKKCTEEDANESAQPGDGSLGLVEGYSSDEDNSPSHDGSDQEHKVTEASSPIKGLSKADLRRLGLKDGSKVAQLSAADIKDTEWTYKSGGEVWSAAKLPVEHGTMQKRKHQITWLASSVVEDEKRIQELAQKSRENRYKSRLKYGF